MIVLFNQKRARGKIKNKITSRQNVQVHALHQDLQLQQQQKNITNITADLTGASVRSSQSTTDFPKMTNTSNAKATATTR